MSGDGGGLAFQTRWQEKALAELEKETYGRAYEGGVELVDYIADHVDGHHRVIRLHLGELADLLAVECDLLTRGRTALLQAKYISPLGDLRWHVRIPGEHRSPGRRGRGRRNRENRENRASKPAVVPTGKEVPA